MDPFVKFYTDRIMVGLVMGGVITIILLIADLLGLARVF